MSLLEGLEKDLVRVSNLLALIEQADEQPGHVAYMTKQSMTNTAAEAQSLVDGMLKQLEKVGS